MGITNLKKTKTFQNTRIDWFFCCPLVLFLFWGMSGYGSIANYISAISCLILIIYSILFRKIRFYSKDIKTTIIFFLLFFCYHFITSIINISNIVYWLGNVIVYFFISYYGIFIINNLLFSKKNAQFVFKIGIALWTLFCFVSIYYYCSNPELAREAIVNQKEYDNLFIGGGYYLAYGSCILAIFVFGLLRKKTFKQIKSKLLAIFFILILVTHVILTKSTLTMIWLFFGLCFELVFGGPTNKRRKKIIFFIFVILLILFLITKKNIGIFLTNCFNYSSESLYNRRLYELGTVLKGNSYTRHTLERLSKPLMSWEQFKTSPIFGVGYKYGYNFSELKISGLGTHSEIVDTLAKYGIIGFSFWVCLFVYYIKTINTLLKEKFVNGWWITLIPMMFFNPFISLPSMIALFVIIPLISINVTDVK